MADGAAMASTRVPISLRLPAAVMREIDDYVAKTGVRKTDAVVHFLQLGIDSERNEDAGDRLSAMEARLDMLVDLVKGMGTGGQLVGRSEPGDQSVQDIFRTARDAVRGVAENYPAIRLAYLFGSVARGEARDESDIDLRLVIDRDERFNLHDLEHFCKEVERKTGREVDAVTASVIKNKVLAEAIEREKVLVYERKEH